MSINLNGAKPQNATGELMPDNTIAPVILNLRGLKKTNAGDATMLDCEFTITAGKFAKRKFWGLMMITSNGSSGHDTAVDITMSRVKGMLDSAYGLDPEDDSDKAQSARVLSDWHDLDGLEFLARIGVEKSKDPQYSDKNVLKAAVTPDQDQYKGFEPGKPAATTTTTKAAPKSAPAQSAASDDDTPEWMK